MQKWNDSDRLRYRCEDARKYEQPAYQYQFIFCDLFDGDKLVSCVYDPSFAEKLHGMICADGILVINCGWEDHPEEVQEAYENVFAYVQNVDREPWQTKVLMASGSPLN